MHCRADIQAVIVRQAVAIAVPQVKMPLYGSIQQGNKILGFRGIVRSTAGIHPGRRKMPAPEGILTNQFEVVSLVVIGRIIAVGVDTGKAMFASGNRVTGPAAELTPLFLGKDLQASCAAATLQEQFARVKLRIISGKSKGVLG